MKHQRLDLVLGSPSFISISILESEDREAAERTFKLIKRDYKPKLIEKGEQSIKIALKDVLCSVELIKEKNCNVFLLSIHHMRDDYISKEWQKDLEYYKNQIQPILNMLPKNPILFLTVFMGSTKSQDEALNLVKQYSEYVGSRKIAAGIVGNCLLATLRKKSGEIDSHFLRRELLLSPIKLIFPNEKFAISDIQADIEYLAINLANLDRLYRLCQPYFSQIDPGEAEIQEKIEGIMNRIRQTEPIDLETLKSWLSDVMDRFSTLSILSGLIKRDLATATIYIEDNRNLLSLWNEMGLKGYPTNTLTETIEYSSVLKPFENFINRTEALGVQLERVSDMVRTFLGIRQQEQSSETQKQQVKILNVIEKHEKLLKNLTWVVAFLTIALVILEIARIMHIIP